MQLVSTRVRALYWRKNRRLLHGQKSGYDQESRIHFARTIGASPIEQFGAIRGIDGGTDTALQQEQAPEVEQAVATSIGGHHPGCPHEGSFEAYKGASCWLEEVL